MHKGRMYFQGKLCVPETLVQRLLWEFHSSAGHLGIAKMSKAVHLRFVLPSSTNTPSLIQAIRQACLICQASAPPHHAKQGNLEHLPVPERAMHSVCLDLFSMPTTNWNSQEFDSILLCVDRLSGWIVAAPTLTLGLSAEKAAHLILEHGWEPFGIPATVHSDQGPQFVGAWWNTMCARLGIHQTFSQPHRPRANGRAERAGQQLLSTLKKLHMQHNLNWVEALPRALAIHHDVPGPGGLSPYHILFGRDRSVQGIPYIPERESEDAQAFFARMDQVDQLVAHALNKAHEEKMQQLNSKPERDPFPPGALVWVYKAPDLASQSKVEAKWKGPLAVHSRTGHRSYLVTDKRGATFGAHVDQLQPYTALGDPGELAGLEGWDREVDRLLACREMVDGENMYHVLWKGPGEGMWVPHSVLMAMGWQAKVEEFHNKSTP